MKRYEKHASAQRKTTIVVIALSSLDVTTEDTTSRHSSPECNDDSVREIAESL
jgi:hypothetical protein